MCAGHWTLDTVDTVDMALTLTGCQPATAQPPGGGEMSALSELWCRRHGHGYPGHLLFFSIFLRSPATARPPDTCVVVAVAARVTTLSLK